MKNVINVFNVPQVMTSFIDHFVDDENKSLLFITLIIAAAAIYW